MTLFRNVILCILFGAFSLSASAAQEVVDPAKINVEQMTSEDIEPLARALKQLIEKSKAEGTEKAIAQKLSDFSDILAWASNTIAERRLPLFGLYVQLQPDFALGSFLAKFNKYPALQWLNRLNAQGGAGGMLVLTRDRKQGTVLGALQSAKMELFLSYSYGGSFVLRHAAEGNVAGSQNSQIFASFGLLVPTAYLFDRIDLFSRYDYSVTTLADLLGHYAGPSIEWSTNFRKGTTLPAGLSSLPLAGTVLKTAEVAKNLGGSFVNKIRFQFATYMRMDLDKNHYAELQERLPYVEDSVRAIMNDPTKNDAVKILSQTKEYLNYYGETYGRGTARTALDLATGKVALIQVSIGFTPWGTDVGAEWAIDYMNLNTSSSISNLDEAIFVEGVDKEKTRKILEGIQNEKSAPAKGEVPAPEALPLPVVVPVTEPGMKANS